jgi:hypothetical protein
MQCSNAVTDEAPSDCDCLPSGAQSLADALDEVLNVERAGRDAFHLVRDLTGREKDALERVPAITGGYRESAVNRPASPVCVWTRLLRATGPSQ